MGWKFRLYMCARMGAGRGVVVLVASASNTDVNMSVAIEIGVFLIVLYPPVSDVSEQSEFVK